MHKKQFTERLTELRMKKGVSARDMSLSLSQNSGYINHIENGQTLPSMSGFFNICDYFSITPQDFFTFENGYPELTKSIVTDLYKLEETEPQSLCTLIQALAKKNN